MGVKIMKLEIGETWINEQPKYKEEIKILGIDGYDNTELSKGDVIVPESNNHLKVKCINNITAEWFETTISLRDLVNRFERQSD